MKFYLLLPLFFLQTLFLPLSISGQQQMTDHPPSQLESDEDAFSHEGRHEEERGNDEFDQHHESFHEAAHTYGLDLHDVGGAWSKSIPHETESFETKFFNMLLVLGLLIGFMFLASWALKRMMKSKLTNINQGSSIKILETRYLSPRATLYLVEVDGESLLIAESPTTVTHLKTLRLSEEEKEN